MAHKFEDEDIREVDWQKDQIDLCYDTDCGYMTCLQIYKEDVIAMAKHFKLTQEDLI